MLNNRTGFNDIGTDELIHGKSPLTKDSGKREEEKGGEETVIRSSNERRKAAKNASVKAKKLFLTVTSGKALSKATSVFQVSAEEIVRELKC